MGGRGTKAAAFRGNGDKTGMQVDRRRVRRMSGLSALPWRRFHTDARTEEICNLQSEKGYKK